MKLDEAKTKIISRLKKGDKVKITLTATIDRFDLYVPGEEDQDGIEFDNPAFRLPFDNNIDLEILELKEN